ncbi:polyprenyl synthetase family protein [Streptomyces sp. NPDC059003]|uniref:polyprenyl synthetase family protein n=1 Tax=Streptomyces sp. NPDC059003 TaxID=3346691 RepID=UPI0036945A25
MTDLAYVDLYRNVSSDIDKTLESAIDRLPVHSSNSVKDAVSEILQARQLKYPLCVLPIMLHAAETGVGEPATPLAAVHVLWWTSACYLDDLADAHSPVSTGTLSGNEALLAAVLAGNSLPLQIIQDLDTSAPVRKALTTEFLNGWTIGVEGQLSDFREKPGSAARESVISAYRGKSGAPYGMITAMASILSGAPSERTAMWREFGYVFGILWQIFNDQEDILSGRHDDLRNGTVTYLLACAVEDGLPADKEQLLELCAAAQQSEPARMHLTQMLRDPALLRRYQQDVTEIRDQAHRLLTALGGEEKHLAMMRELVEDSARIRLYL